MSTTINNHDLKRLNYTTAFKEYEKKLKQSFETISNNTQTISTKYDNLSEEILRYKKLENGKINFNFFFFSTVLNSSG